jgi:hypothetical protein
MRAHNVVIAVTLEVGNDSAAIVAIQLLNDFTSIRFSAHGKCAEARSVTQKDWQLNLQISVQNDGEVPKYGERMHLSRYRA